jgi:succinate dehydrogenase / fumarate reductase membrane anchor subunit
MAAHSGSGHFKRQRLTAVLLLPLVLFFVCLLVSLVGAGHPTVVRRLASPLVSLPLLALVLTGAWHMWLGMQVIIDDYARGGARSSLLILSSIFATLTALAAIYAIYQLSFGA